MNIFRGFGRRHVYLALGFTLVTQIAHSTNALLSKEQVQWDLTAVWTLISFVIALLAIACAVASDNLLGERASTATRLVVAMLAAAVVSTAAVELLVTLAPQLESKHMGDFFNLAHRLAFHFTLAVGGSLLLIPLYMMLAASARATERLHEAHLRSLAAERHMVEADLRAMQARVEPDLLFAALGAVDQGYARNVETGERALDAVIAYLRAALPAEPGSTSTVAAELDLVRAYVDVAKLLSTPKLELEIAAEPTAARFAIPAMLLLPLTRWAMDGAAAALKLVARQGNGVLEISLRSDLAGSGSGGTQDIAGVRERLENLYGTRAKLEATAEPTMRRAFIALPV